MPEGDTVHRIAAQLRPRLVGATLDAGRVVPRRAGTPPFDLPPAGITDVRAVGKHLWIAFDDGTSLRSHLGMRGAWHRYAKGEPWRKSATRATIRLDVGGDTFVCFDALEVELVAAGGPRARHLQARVGADLAAAAAPDLAALPARARALREPGSPVADALLDQRVASGIGNVYKSEVLFLGGVDPRRPLAAVDDATLVALFASARALLRKNLGGGPRVTRFAGDGAGRLWVYRRAGRACFRCGAPIAAARLGAHGRSTYWCPRCQA